jgi:hypothetical protein
MDASMNPGDFTFAGVENVLVSGLVTLVSTISIVGLLLQIILMIALGWNYFKLLLEVVERYIVVGVLCYTSPLAFAMGGAKATNKVFQSWCRMVGSQLLLLVLNVWFLRAFNSSVAHFVANGGALTSGQGNMFLWLFCALAFLKTAQKFDSYLASLGLSVAQTGSGMGMEMLMGLRMLSGFAGGGPRSAGNVFKGGSAVSGVAGGTGGFMSGLTSKFKGNSYVRDAVVDGGTRMGAGGSVGFVGRAFGGMAARSGAELTGDSISSVAVRPSAVSGSIGGDIADRSLKNYMPQMMAGSSVTSGGLPGADSGGALQSDSPLAGVKYSETQITGGHISTTATLANGDTASVDMYSTSQFDKPSDPHSIVTASDGSQWYQMASGDGMGAFYSTPQFSGDAGESAYISEAFPGTADGTSMRTVDDGVIETSHHDNGTSVMLSSAHYQEPDAPHESITDSKGTGWYSMHPQASVPEFESGNIGETGMDYNRAQFQQFMPGYENSVSQVDSSRHSEGVIEVRHADGSGTQFFDKTQYHSPRGDHNVYEDSRGNQWYAIPGTPAVDRRPVYEDGKPVYDGENLRTTNVESVRYKTTPTRFDEPKKRDVFDRKPPNPKRR